MKNATLEKFTLLKINIKGQGLEMDFEVEETTGVEVFHDSKKLKSDKKPHPDLTGILAGFKAYMADIYYLSGFKELIHSKAFNPNEEQTEQLNAQYERLKGLITVTGVSISGKDDNKGIIITAKLRTETGHEVAINSQRIKYNGTKYGWEEELEEVIAQLEEEAFEYAVNGKQAQLEMAFDNSDQTDFKSAAAGGMFDEQEEEELYAQSKAALDSDEEE